MSLEDLRDGKTSVDSLRGMFVNWNKEANEVLRTVPSFVRGQVREWVEEEAARCGAQEVCLEHVQACRRRFLESMEEEFKGYRIETCFGPSGCRNRAVGDNSLPQELEVCLSRRNLKAFLRERVKGPLKMHHEFRVSVSDCPNACSRPQIADLGLIGARRPTVSAEPCTQCGACLEVCGEGAISCAGDVPLVDYSKCLSCGQCLAVCPTRALQEAASGYRILVGGKLGRHPQLGRELPGIYRVEDVLKVVEQCLDHYQRNCLGGERFCDILNRTGLTSLVKDVEDEP